MKSLGWWYSVDLSDKEQVEEGLGRIDRSRLPGKAEIVVFAVWIIP